MSSSMPNHIKTIKYKIVATIERVKIAKKLKFKSKVQWKRHQNAAETSLVQHQNEFSVFDQQLQLEFSMYYDTNKNVFLQKKVDMIVVIDVEGSIKNGGYARFDLSEPLNNRLECKSINNKDIDKKLTLVKNPDPQAYIQFNLRYEHLQQVDCDQMSVMNMTNLDMTTTDFPSQSNFANNSSLKQSKITSNNSQLLEIVSKLEELSKKFKIKKNNNVSQKDSQKVIYLEAQIKQLLSSNKQLQTKTKSSQKQIVSSSQSQQQMIKQQKQQIQQLKKQLQQKNVKQSNSDNKLSVQVLKGLQQDKIKLQKQLAEKSNKIGQLFNAALQIGGPQLMDRLQNAIGLIEQQQ